MYIANIDVKKLLEGSSRVIAGSLNAKMINGASVDIKCKDDASIGAMYADKSSITSSKNISLFMVKGYTYMHSSEGNINVRGIDGSFDITAMKGMIDLQINKLYKNSVSTAHSLSKSVAVKLNPEVCMCLYMFRYIVLINC